MTQLELTLLEMAQQTLDALLRVLDAKGSRVSADDVDEFQRNEGALNKLLELGHMTKSGMCEEAAKAMRDIEAKHAEVIRNINSPADFIYTTGLFPKSAELVALEDSMTRTLALGAYECQRINDEDA